MPTSGPLVHIPDIILLFVHLCKSLCNKKIFLSPQNLLLMDSTTKDDDYPMIYRVLSIPGGAGFRPSTVSRPVDHLSISYPKDDALPVFFAGDALREPFWPMGEGCSRGFMGAFDTVWTVRWFHLREEKVNGVSWFP